MNVDWIISTTGDGFWSSSVNDVRVIRLEASGYGQLDVYLDPKTWTEEDGLVYTDTGFIQGLRAKLEEAGLTSQATSDMDYSEQGMQDTDRVNFDVGIDFEQEWFEPPVPREQFR